jgi:hypothetical protein
MPSALAKLAAFAVSLITFAMAYKYVNLEGWETYAFVGGGLLFFVITIIIGKTFNEGIIGSLFISSIITAIVMWFVTPAFSLIMILIFLFLLMLIIAAAEQSNYSGGW